MKAECVYDIILLLKEEERVRLFKLLEMPMPPVLESPYISGWDKLAVYLDTPKRNLANLEKEGIIKKYKLGKKVMFKKEEINAAIKPVE